MSIHKLQRVLWRIRSQHGNKHITYKQLRTAIMNEIGTSPECYQTNKENLKRLEWIKTTRNRVILTGKDLQ